MPMEDMLTSLQTKYKEMRAATLVILVLLVTALIFAFLNRIVTFVLLGSAVLYHFLFLRKKQKKYADSVVEANLSCTIVPSIQASSLHPGDGDTIQPATLEHASLMPIKKINGSPLLCWGMHGLKNGLAVSLCDATIAQDFRLKKTGRKRVHFNSGVWVHIDFADDLGKRFCLLDEASVPTPIRMDYFSGKSDFHTFPVGNDIVGKRCVLYQPSDRHFKLSSSLLHEIQKLLEYTPGYLAISVKGHSIDFFLRGRFMARPVSLSKAPTQELLAFDPLPELAYLIRIAKKIAD